MQATFIPGATYKWYINGTEIVGSITSTHTSGGPLDLPNFIRNGSIVQVTVTTAGSCTITATKTFNENAIEVGGILSTATPTMCANTAASIIVGPTSLASGTITEYQWWESPSGLGGTYTRISGAGAATVTYNPGILSATRFYKRKIRFQLFISRYCAIFYINFKISWHHFT